MKMNPFIYNTPVRGDDFCNRVDTIQRLLNQTVTGKSQGNVWLVGERQVGKTSLLRYIQLAYEDFNERIHIYGSTETVKVAFIYFNCQTLKNPDDYYHHIYQSLINHFDFKHTEQENAYSCYIETFKRAYASNYYIVLLLDEFDAFLKRLIQKNADQAEYLLSDINKMSQAFSEIKIEPKVFGCIFAANYTLSALVEKINVPGSGLISEMIELPFFTFQQMKELADHYLKDDALQFSDQDVQYCYEMTNGYPYLVQKLFSLLYDHYQLQTNDEIDYQKITHLYQQELNSTIAHWGNETMPPRTKTKIQGIHNCL